VITPTGYLEKSSEKVSAAFITPKPDFIFEDNSKLEIITDSDDLEQPTKIANYDYSMQYVAIIYEGKQYMVAIPTDDIEELNPQERLEITADAQREAAMEEMEDIEEINENLEDSDDALGLFSYIYALDQASDSAGSFSEGEEARNSSGETVSTQQISNEKLEDSSNSYSFFEYFSRRFLA
jgi:hypothetical protein